MVELMMEEVIKVESLSFHYPDGQQALSNVSFSVKKGESVALIGPNGAGKSTVLLHLNGILRGNGQVKVFGASIDDKNVRWIRSKIGLVFQNPDDQLFSPTVFDDVAFGPINMRHPEPEVRESVARALDWVGMSGYEQRSPNHLSLGEKKRITLATVLSMMPEVLVLDEPTANLDPRGKWSLISLLKRLPMTKIIASHDLDAVRSLCPRIIILDHGQTVADGPADQILADLPLLRAHGLAPAQELSLP